jgi:hypothetical protein
MDTRHLNTYLSLIEALLHCAKGEEWLLLQQHEDLIDAELLPLMAQVAEQLSAEGNVAAAQFLHYWIVQLTHLLQQDTPAETPAENRAESYVNLIQTLLGCSKGDEITILNQHPDLLDEGLVYTMNQVAAQLAAKGSQDIAIYLKHLAAEVNRVCLHPSEERTPISSPPLNRQNGHINSPPSTGVATVSNLHPDERSSVATAPKIRSSPPLNTKIVAPPSTGVATLSNLHPDERSSVATTPPARLSPPLNGNINELLEKIFSRLEKLEILMSNHQTPLNPLWYMPILEQVDTQSWIISSEEVEQLIGIKPHCAPGDNFFVRGCWKFVKTGKVGTHLSWRVIKEIVTLPSDLTPEPEGTDLEPELLSPWTEGN